MSKIDTQTSNSTNSSMSSLYYAKLEDVVKSNDISYLQTKNPTFNHELHKYVHNFGGRVKVASNCNFLVCPHSGPRLNRNDSNYGHAAEYGDSGRVCIRHGKVR
jgi:hypothetical protein